MPQHGFTVGVSASAGLLDTALLESGTLTQYEPRLSDNSMAHPLAADSGDRLQDATDVAALARQLHEKEQLIVALTDRLEQAAEQLDRLRRTGADRGPRRGGGAMPLELIDEHRTAVEELKQAVTRWEEMQAGMTLGRIETQIAELRDLVVGFVDSPSARGTKDSAEPAAAGDARKSTPATWWEQQKATMLGDAAPANSPVESPAAQSNASAETVASLNLAESPVPDLPSPVDFENLSLEEAKAAIRARDCILAQLHEPLLLAQLAAIVSQHAGGLDQLPDPIRERLVSIETQWQARFRQIELDLSVERARLAREEASLRQQQDQLRKELARLGVREKSEQADASYDNEGDNSDPVPRRRWFRFLQTPEEEDEE